MQSLPRLLLTGFTSFMLFSGAAMAQDDVAAAADPASETVVRSADGELNRYVTDDEPTVDDGYAVPTFKNLSKLYWALAMFDMAEDSVIDSYLMINECELYSKFYASDFELVSLRKATRESIVKSMSSFPRKFEIMIPVGLDRYDTGTEKFKLAKNSFFLGTKRLEIAVNDVFKPVCGKKRDSIPGYPKNFILSLSRPFTVTEIAVKPEIAQMYIEEMQKVAKERRYYFTFSPFGRVAYLRLKVSMNQFKGYVPRANSEPLTDIFGTIDSYDLYADREKKFPMHVQNVETRKIYRRKKLPVSDEAMKAANDEIQQQAPAAPQPVAPAPAPVPAPQ